MTRFSNSSSNSIIQFHMFFIFWNMFPESRGFVAMPVTGSIKDRCSNLSLSNYSAGKRTCSILQPSQQRNRHGQETCYQLWMFLWMFIPLISGGPLLNLRCSPLVRHCLRSLVRVVDWCVSRLVRLICCQIILAASSPGRLLICRSLAICLLVLPPSHSGRVR